MCIFGGGGDSTSTTTQTSSLPPWLNEAAQDVYGAAEAFVTGPGGSYPTYDEPRVAGFSPLQEAGFQQFADVALGGLPEQLLGQGMNLLEQGTQPFGGAEDLQKFMNPFQDSVIDPVINEINRQYEMAQIGKDAADVQQGAFGTASRRDVYSTELQKRRVEDISRYVSQLNMTNYNQAYDRYQQERMLGQTGGQAYQQMAGFAQQLGFNSAEELIAAGAVQQQQAQQSLSLRYQDFLNQFYFPKEQISWLANILTGNPAASEGTKTTVSPGGSDSAQSLGALAALLGGAGTFLGSEGLNIFG